MTRLELLPGEQRQTSIQFGFIKKEEEKKARKAKSRKGDSK